MLEVLGEKWYGMFPITSLLQWTQSLAFCGGNLMVRRVFLCALVAALAVCSCLAVKKILSPGSAVTVSNFKRLRTGMAASDVERVLGRPSAAESTYASGSFRFWAGDDLRVEAEFGKDSQLLWAIAHDPDLSWTETAPACDSLFDALWCWLRG